MSRQDHFIEELDAAEWAHIHQFSPSQFAQNIDDGASDGMDDGGGNDDDGDDYNGDDYDGGDDVNGGDGVDASQDEDNELSTLGDLYGYEDDEDNLEAAHDDVLKIQENS